MWRRDWSSDVCSSDLVRNARKGGKALSLVNTLALKTLQYIHSRDLDSYRPIPSRSSKVGYVYPMLTENLDFNQQEKAFEILEIAEKASRSEEHTSELQSRGHLVCRLLLEHK